MVMEQAGMGAVIRALPKPIMQTAMLHFGMVVSKRE